MAGPSLIPSGDFRTTYAADTTIFPTTTSRNFAIARHHPGLLRAAGVQQLLAQHLDPDRHLRDRSARPQHPGRLHRPDLDRPRRVLPARRLHLGLHLQQPADPGVLRHSARRRRHRAGRADLRRAGGAAEGALSRHRDAGRAIHPARFLLARRLVLRRLGAGQRQSVLDLRLYVPRRQAIFLRGAGLSRGQLPAGDQSDAHARRPRAGRDPRSLSLRRDHGHQPHQIPHAVVRARGLLRRHRRRALRALSAGGLATKVLASSARSCFWR